ncbi:hypothetical protein [Pseudomonas leptonychotis]|uniref:Uncharacterized protein n=1 Tax=Pseudomonas leptonychotis TaxID=2448482 RepID=A0A4T2A722_9PSED|nr:hypothetical protein [Pseudomonas leptonychotis]TIH10816.1 hypothetical protein D8779_09110 [Pseudomonas leptonychotis]
MAETVSKTIHYKRAVISGGGNLQEILGRVFADGSPAHKVGQRKEIVSADTNSFRVVNHKRDYNGMLFCQMIYFEPGRSQAYITLNDEAESYALDALTNEALNNINEPAEREQHRKEFVDSFLYFGVFENHLVVLQSSALRSRELEAHLGWLIGSFGGVAVGTAIILQDQPSQETFERVARSPVKKIEVGSPVTTAEVVPEGERVALPAAAAEEEQGIDARRVRFFPTGFAGDVIKAALGADWFNRLDLEDDLDEANLKVSLEITYVRQTTKMGQQMLDNIATSLRHVDEADVRISLNGGGEIKGNDLKLSGPVSVSKLDNGLLDEGVLYHKMHGWLVSKLRQGDVDPEQNAEE